jgi:hypothetical protein
VAVWSRQARVNRYPRHGEPDRIPPLSSEPRGGEQVTLGPR